MKTLFRDRAFVSDIVARLCCALFMVVIGGLAFTKSNSIPGQALVLQGDYLAAVFGALFIVAGLICIDVLVNSLMPDSYKIDTIRRNRDIMYVVGGGLALLPAWYISREFGLSWVEGSLYLGAPILIFYMALCDIKSKYEARCFETK